MSQIRYSLAPSETLWVLRRDCARVGVFSDTAAAAAAALKMAAADRVRGHAVEVLRLEEDGRWTLVGTANRHLCEAS